MFTGIIEATGKVSGVKKTAGGLELSVTKPSGWKVKAGDSINVNGVCSTVKNNSSKLEFFYMPETLAKSAVGKLQVGNAVNLERSLQASSRLDGHIVQGHVDATGIIKAIHKRGGSHEFTITLGDKKLMKLIAAKGAVALEGISLTVVDVLSFGFTVDIIPYTWQHTNLQEKKSGDAVNIECDILAKYLQRLI